MKLRVSEVGLRRYAERFEPTAISFVGRKAFYTMYQEMVEVDDTPRGAAYVTIEGERQFGGYILFDEKPTPAIQGPVNAEDVQTFHLSAGYMAKILNDLCDCGCFEFECSCCPKCAAKGRVDGERCKDCDGRGYVSAAGEGVGSHG